MRGVFDFLRNQTPWNWGVVGVALLIAATLVVALAGGVGLRWDPFGLGRQRLDRAEARAEFAEAEAAARRLEVQGGRDQSRRVETHTETVRAVEIATAAVVQSSGAADDASIPLDPARAGRLSAHDRELCRLAPGLVGCAATAGPAGGGDAGLRPGGASG